MTTKKEEKPVKPVDNAVFKEKVDMIVQELYIQEDSRETVNEIVKELKSEYGLKPSVVRKIASTIHKRNKEQLEQESDDLINLLDTYYKS